MNEVSVLIEQGWSSSGSGDLDRLKLERKLASGAKMTTISSKSFGQDGGKIGRDDMLSALYTDQKISDSA